jgi:hypothetical protein
MKKLPKLLVVATTDSYLKWAIGLRGALPDSWHSTIFIAKSLQNPSPRQISMALAGSGQDTVKAKHILSLAKWVRREKPDAVLVAATGPFLVLLRWVLNASSQGRRTKLISGSPGVAYHLIGEPLRARTTADLLLVASHAEYDRLGAAIKDLGAKADLAIASLPFLRGLKQIEHHDGPETIVFAPQPDMPKTREDREAILLGLSSLKERFPDLKIIIKLRATKKEPQTHFETFSYQQLATELDEKGEIAGANFHFELGSVVDQMKNQNALLMTLSSTAALESIAMGNPTQIISDYGTLDSIATSVFENSGLMWKLEDFPLAKVQKPRKTWLEKNYFHDPQNDDWIEAIFAMCQRTHRANASIIPRNLGLSLFAGEFLRVMFPNKFGETLIRSLKSILGKGSA